MPSAFIIFPFPSTCNGGITLFDMYFDMPLIASKYESKPEKVPFDFPEVVALVKRKKLRPAPVETRPAQRANEALEDLKAGRVIGRVVLDFSAVAA